ncbi:S8 family serine peptidase [Reichenbachiella sp.]|uniref:S8 family serine peptidase n=1 Tax=Reichenbachiella sp. TaxID=2184521 RepID=UPI003BB18422
MKQPKKIGHLLQQTFEMLESGDRNILQSELTKVGGAISESTGNHIPVILKIATHQPHKAESWSSYKRRINRALKPVFEHIDQIKTDVPKEQQPKALISANSIRYYGLPGQIQALINNQVIERIELDPTLQLTQMDDAISDVGLPEFHVNHGKSSDGSGVSVAVLDSGIDTKHPFLNVKRSVSTVGEPVSIPGDHGTHCAGSIASTDSIFPGIAPGVDLYNIKVLRSDGRGSHTNVVQGIDKALDFGADILSMSLGFNHLPKWSSNGHGWMCDNGHCPLCVAVDNAVLLDNTVVVVAAGNDHMRAEALRNQGSGNTFDTELGCPGQAREAITVGAIHKRSFHPAAFSSQGTTSYHTTKPDLVAPGVNITSTIPVPRNARGQLMAKPPRSLLFDRKDGTSMATPMVSAACALIIEKMRASNMKVTPYAVKQQLYQDGIIAMRGKGRNVIGRGRLTLSKVR